MYENVVLKMEKRWKHETAFHHRGRCALCFGFVFLMGQALPQLNLVSLAGFSISMHRSLQRLPHQGMWKGMCRPEVCIHLHRLF